MYGEFNLILFTGIWVSLKVGFGLYFFAFDFSFDFELVPAHPKTAYLERWRMKPLTYTSPHLRHNHPLWQPNCIKSPRNLGHVEASTATINQMPNLYIWGKPRAVIPKQN